MSKEMELMRGSGNAFRDFDIQNADAEQLRAILAAQIVRALDERHLTVRQAESLTGIAAADFSRIRRARLERFTIDRLMTVLSRLDYKVEVSVTVRPTQDITSTHSPESVPNGRHGAHCSEDMDMDQWAHAPASPFCNANFVAVCPVSD